MALTRVAINGFGRIGRLAARMLLERDDLELTAINDLADDETLTYLFKHDSTQGTYAQDVSYEPGALRVNGKSIRMTEHRDPNDCKWGEVADIVLDCTGVFLTRERCQAHFDSGAKYVLLSAPAKDADITTICVGVNCDSLDPKESPLISNASCTTNCVASPLKALDDAFGLEWGALNTVHAYTISQSLLDSPNSKIRQSRAAALNLVPSSTGAAKAVGRVLPHLNGKLDGMAIRTPNPSGSIADLTMTFKNDPTIEQAHAALAAYAAKHPSVLNFSTDELVSTDVVGQRYSSIIDSKMTMKVGPLLKILCWYDNEAGYAARLVDLAAIVSQRG
ncbi:MAG: glyceraldehyde 3-phosphate dehydrogenase [Myxococcota bacterium]|jgi:glyceraldehyde 3-phosphate dehydrogenase